MRGVQVSQCDLIRVRVEHQLEVWDQRRVRVRAVVVEFVIATATATGRFVEDDHPLRDLRDCNFEQGDDIGGVLQEFVVEVFIVCDEML